MKRIADTSRTAFRDWQPQRAKQEAMVLVAIDAYRREHGQQPTGRELLAFLQVQHPGLDVNSVRPNLTRLEDRGDVAKGAKRRCSITGVLVYSWEVRSRRVAAPEPVGASNVAVIQGSFFSGPGR